MEKRRIRTIAGLQRAWNARNVRSARFYKRPYTLQPALARHLDRFKHLEQIKDPDARYQAFRQLPSLEFELEAVNGSFTPKQRESLAQRDRATRPRGRLTEDGQTLEAIVFALLAQVDDPWLLKAKQYWTPTIERLRQLGLNPTLGPDLVTMAIDWTSAPHARPSPASGDDRRALPRVVGRAQCSVATAPSSAE
jgi:hypothetical protein